MDKVCLGCVHCIKSHDEKFDMTVHRCKEHDRHLSYPEVLGCRCKDWKKGRE